MRGALCPKLSPILLMICFSCCCVRVSICIIFKPSSFFTISFPLLYGIVGPDIYICILHGPKRPWALYYIHTNDDIFRAQHFIKCFYNTASSAFNLLSSRKNFFILILLFFILFFIIYLYLIIISLG